MLQILEKTFWNSFPQEWQPWVPFLQVARTVGPVSPFYQRWRNLKEIEAHMTKIRPEWLPLVHDACSICQENFQIGQLVVPLLCHHTFHLECLSRQTLQSSVVTCATCRCPLSFDPAFSPCILGGECTHDTSTEWVQFRECNHWRHRQCCSAGQEGYCAICKVTRTIQRELTQP